MSGKNKALIVESCNVMHRPDCSTYDVTQVETVTERGFYGTGKYLLLVRLL
jgi:hypothetical protein